MEDHSRTTDERVPINVKRVPDATKKEPRAGWGTEPGLRSATREHVAVRGAGFLEPRLSCTLSGIFQTSDVLPVLEVDENGSVVVATPVLHGRLVRPQVFDRLYVNHVDLPE